jgi:hypothetical protein
MAKKKGKKRSYRRKTGISLIGLAETFALANVATNTLFNNNLTNFLMGGTGAAAQGSSSITLQELFQPAGRFHNNPAKGLSGPMSYIGRNMRKNWMTGAAGMILIPIGFRVGKALARPAITKANRLLGRVGISKTVKV